MAAVTDRTDPAHLLGTCLVAILLVGCSDTDSSEGDSSRIRPLQPLVYTEDPDQTPSAAAARERRLLRRLRHGARTDGHWGDMSDSSSSESFDELASADALGRALFEAIVEGDADRWDYVFVAPRDYASLVEVDLKRARRFVDRQQAAARPVRRAFHIERASERPKGGLASLFEYESFELGSPRTIRGDQVDEGAPAQYWNNVLRFSLTESDVQFRIDVPKVLRFDVPERRDGAEDAEAAENADPKQEAYRLGVASTLEIGRKLHVFLDAGFHLKPELLDAAEYPFPLQVGNFWRYRRRTAEAPSRSSSSSELTVETPLEATEVTVSVEGVDRYRTRRLVHLRARYNDADLTLDRAYWLLSPRRIYICPRPCRRQVDDLDWLLRFLARQTPIFVFPLERGRTWGGSEDRTFEVVSDWTDAEVPAGSFFGSTLVEGTGPLGDDVPFGSIDRLQRVFSPGNGIVERRYRTILDGEQRRVVETLSDYRIMPR